MTNSTDSTDRIEKKIQLRAPRARVWRALTNAEEFGAWFGVKLQGTFTAGAQVQGQITQAGYEHVKLNFTIDRIDPEHSFSYRWHPYAIDPRSTTPVSRPRWLSFTWKSTKEGLCSL